MQTQRRGFTIVELLIIIVVIAILAAISIVAYTGIQNRAHDSAIQNDLASLSRQLEIFYVDAETYPDGGQLTQLNFSASRSAYETSSTSHNLIYCWDDESLQNYVVTTLSRSGSIFYISSEDSSTQRFTGNWRNGTNMCRDAAPDISLTYNMRGFAGEAANPWRPWTGSN